MKNNITNQMSIYVHIRQFHKLCPPLHEPLVAATAEYLTPLALCHLHIGQHCAGLVLHYNLLPFIFVIVYNSHFL